jgi:crotonobetainyl-CoA:carnitine CoA-transferase CaiB-like acyl-CoA transferase
MDGQRPLSGVKVLDLSRVFAGPVAGRVLADLGADVVKVEPPEGDITRLWGTTAAGLSTYFVQQNSGKRNICIDLRAEGGPELVADLAAEADVVLENFRPGVLARYGLDYPTLAARNPGLVMASISGFGQDGPESQRMAYAPIVHAEVGLIGHREGETTGDLSFSAADVLSGLHGVIGLLAALRVRDQTGIGQHVDVAMVDAMAFSSDAIISSLDDQPRGRQAGNVWETAAGPVMVAGDLKWMWHQMSTVHGLQDPTPSDAPVREKVLSRRRLITEHLCALADREAVVRCLDEAGLAWGELRSFGSVLDTPTTRHRQTVVSVDDRQGGTRPVVGSPYHLSRSGRGRVGPPAFRGEHNDEVLGQWLGLDGGTARRLASDGILQRDEWAAGGSGVERGDPPTG